tara:strand:+ start:1205 stop:1711 length:507 start_codon:yes stop_codon:yes gene_type:complete
MKKINILIYSIAFGFFAQSCGDTNQEENVNLNIIEVITSDPNKSPFYFNFLTGEENNNVWQLSYKALAAGQGYFMPSIDLSDKILLFVENDKSFNEIESAPTATSFVAGNGKLSYGGENEVLSYDMTIHKIGVSDATFIIYDTTSERAFKLKFVSYDSWIVTYKYAEL